MSMSRWTGDRPSIIIKCWEFSSGKGKPQPLNCPSALFTPCPLSFSPLPFSSFLFSQPLDPHQHKPHMLNLRNTFSLIADNQSQRFPPPPPPPLSLSLIPPIPTKPIAFIVIDLKLSRWSKYVKEKVIICWNFSRDYCHPKTMTHTHTQAKQGEGCCFLLAVYEASAPTDRP